MLNNSIKVSKLQVIRKEKDCTFRWYTLHVPRFWQFFKISNYNSVAFFPKHPVGYVYSKMFWYWFVDLVCSRAKRGTFL